VGKKKTVCTLSEIRGRTIKGLLSSANNDGDCMWILNTYEYTFVNLKGRGWGVPHYL